MLKRVIAVCVLLVGLSPVRVGTGSITGIVEDASGARIAGSLIRIVNANSGSSSEITANRDGAYRIDSLVPGQYAITGSATGFDSASRNVVLTTSQVLAVDFKLTVGRSANRLSSPRLLPSRKRRLRAWRRWLVMSI